MPYTFGYWNGKGLGHPIRQLLILLGEADYEEVTWSSFEGWEEKKKEVFTGQDNTTLPQCPYVIDGDLVITESTVIPFYLCNRPTDRTFWARICSIRPE